MDGHHAAHYGIAALLAASVGTIGLHSLKTPVQGYDLSADAPGLAFGKHSYIVYSAPGSLSAASALAASIRAHGGTAKIEMDSNEHLGLWIAPKGDESEKIASALAKDIPEGITVDDYDAGAKAYGTPYQIGVGIPAK